MTPHLTLTDKDLKELADLFTEGLVKSGLGGSLKADVLTIEQLERFVETKRKKQAEQKNNRRTYVFG